MRQALGVAVFFGMIGVTIFGLLFTPSFYVITRKLAAMDRPPEARRPRGSGAETAEVPANDARAIRPWSRHSRSRAASSDPTRRRARSPPRRGVRLIESAAAGRRGAPLPDNGGGCSTIPRSTGWSPRRWPTIPTSASPPPICSSARAVLGAARPDACR